MEKKIYCLIGERCKRITFSSQKDIPDVRIVHDRLIEVSNNDILLKSMINDKVIVLQKFDPDRNNKLCDIEEDEEIEDKSEVKVLLLKNPSFVAESITNVIPDVPVSFSTKKEIDEPCASVDIKIIHTEPANLDDELLIEKSIEIDNVEETILIQEKENYIAVPSTSYDNYDTINNSSQHNVEEMQINLSATSESIPYPAILPTLSYDLQQKLENDGILKAQRYFIAFWGQYLWQITHTKPTKLDYSNLALSIVAAYPQLAGGKGGCEIVRSQLSVWIRNHRAFLKKQTLKRNYKGKPKDSTTFASVKTSLVPTESDIAKALKELEKKFVENNNISHIKQLLKITMSARRSWIEKESSGIVEIVSKYPSLKYYEISLMKLNE